MDTERKTQIYEKTQASEKSMSEKHCCIDGEKQVHALNNKNWFKFKACFAYGLAVMLSICESYD